jgi:hypothetical protein
MATKYFCDGCDKEFEKKENSLATVSLPFTPQTAPALWKAVDLCERCLDGIHRRLNTRESQAAASR